MGGTACVIGSGPNGLSSAIVLAQAGFAVEVFESQPVPGGATRTLELTEPGFFHDFGSAVYPLGAGSPFFRSIPLLEYGLEWIHSPSVLAHPFDDGTALTLERNLRDTEEMLGEDGHTWGDLVRPFAERWWELAIDVLRPFRSLPRHPWLMARFGRRGIVSAESVIRQFRGVRTRALFAGLAAHSVLPLDQLLSGAFGLLMAAAAHAVGWPIPRGGAQTLTNALCRYFSALGGKVNTRSRVDALDSVRNYSLILCDLTPRQVLRIAGERFSPSYRQKLARFRYGPGVFKVDYALRQPIPWTAPECLRAATVHLGGTFEEIAAAERAVNEGRAAQQPFVLLTQPSLFDGSRAPANLHTAWAYCHVPNGWQENTLEPLENQIERFAPGFRNCVITRRVLSPAGLEAMDENLVGGDIAGGANDLWQLLFRCQYATPEKRIYLCSASTPPGGGVHGMCGYNAALAALRRCGIKSAKLPAS